MSRKLMLAIGVIAISAFTSGAVLAGSVAPKTAKACVNANGALKLVQDGSCGANDPIQLTGKTYQGIARAYAHVLSDGTLDTSRSWNVDAGDLVTTNDGFWCFKTLGFTPKSAAVTLDYWSIFNGQIPVAEIVLPPDPSDCDLASAQLEVFTGLVDPGVFTSGEMLGFYIIIY